MKETHAYGPLVIGLNPANINLLHSEKKGQEIRKEVVIMANSGPGEGGEPPDKKRRLHKFDGNQCSSTIIFVIKPAWAQSNQSVFRIRTRMFLEHPDQLVTSTDPDPDHSLFP